MDKKQPFFSIIMPVFNTEKYLDKAINSILNQTFKDFELILIDDCSKDSSYDVCLKYAKQDNRIFLIKNNINIGVSFTRNRGLEVAKGIYVTFIDSDDYIAFNLLEEVYKKLNSTKEIIECLKYGVMEEYFIKDKLKYQKKCTAREFFSMNRKEIQNEVLNLELIPLFGYSCNSFYYLKIIKDNNIKFEKYSMNEDFVFNVKYFSVIKKFCFMDFIGYYYAKRGNNSLSSKKQDKYYDLHMMKIKLFLNMCNEINNLTSQNKKIIFWMYTRFVYSTIERNLNNSKYIINLINRIKSDELYKQFLLVEFKKISKKQALMIFCLKHANNNILLVLTKFISLMKKSFPIIFAKFKG